MDDQPEQARGFLAIGHIVGPHGIRGEVKVVLLTDFPTERYQSGLAVYVGTADKAIPAKIVSARPHKEMLLVKLDSTPDRNAAELLRDQFVLIPDDQAMPLGEHENYCHDLIGLAVEAQDGEALGRVTEIVSTRGANDVYVVSGPQGELLLPALRSVVLSVDLASRKMLVELPEGIRD